MVHRIFLLQAVDETIGQRDVLSESVVPDGRVGAVAWPLIAADDASHELDLAVLVEFVVVVAFVRRARGSYFEVV